MQIAALTAAALALLLDLATHRVQRATLAVAHLRTECKADRREVGRLQLAMTPDWVGHLGLLEFVSAAIAAFLIYFAFSWWGLVSFGVLYLGGLFAGLGGLVIPLMPYPWILREITRHLAACRLAASLGQRVPSGATNDLGESLQLYCLAEELRSDFLDGKVSVESIAAGYLPTERGG